MKQFLLTSTQPCDTLNLSNVVPHINRLLMGQVNPPTSRVSELLNLYRAYRSPWISYVRYSQVQNHAFLFSLCRAVALSQKSAISLKHFLSNTAFRGNITYCLHCTKYFT